VTLPDGVFGRVVAMVALLGVSAMFSGAEAAFFSLSRLEVRRWRDSQSANRRRVALLLSEPRRLLVTILLGNLIVNVVYFSLAASVGVAFAVEHGTWGGLIASAAALVALILTGELIPKAAAVRRPGRSARFAAWPIVVFQRTIVPVRDTLEAVTRVTTRWLGGSEPAPTSVTHEELRWLAERGVEEGELGLAETRLIHDVLALRDVRVREVMKPRVDLVSVESTIDRQALTELLRRTPTRRVLVHDGDVDRANGCLRTRELLEQPDAAPAALVRDVRIVPDSKSVASLLTEMRTEKFDAALVVDEYGGTEGLVTIEDLVADVMGEIADQLGDPASEIQSGGRHRWVARGALPIRDLERIVDVELPDEEVDTLGGFVAARLCRLPNPGDVVRVGELTIEVRSMAGRRVDVLVVIRQPDAS